jgi:hypothetical protein
MLGNFEIPLLRRSRTSQRLDLWTGRGPSPLGRDWAVITFSELDQGELGSIPINVMV